MPKPQSRIGSVARVGLANYFAGALVLPYERFLRAAEANAYDIELLSLGFRSASRPYAIASRRCSDRPTAASHSSSSAPTAPATSQTPKRHRISLLPGRGNCPLWVVHDAFSTPGRIVTQTSQMPDGRSYSGWPAPPTKVSAISPHKSFAIGLGCDIAHAHKLIYSTGIDLTDAAPPSRSGPAARVCDRPACPQRAFPQLGRPIHIDAGISDSIPLPPGTGLITSCTRVAGPFETLARTSHRPQGSRCLVATRGRRNQVHPLSPNHGRSDHPL